MRMPTSSSSQSSTAIGAASGTGLGTGLATAFLLGLPLWFATGCVTIEQLNPTMGQSLPPYYGRAYFLKKTPTGSSVLVCDVKPNNSGVVCYDSGNSTP